VRARRAGVVLVEPGREVPARALLEDPRFHAAIVPGGGGSGSEPVQPSLPRAKIVDRTAWLEAAPRRRL
jgi:hypothetical protein